MEEEEGGKSKVGRGKSEERKKPASLLKRCWGSHE
jgi:hypothetical protein